jgi:hypothetical protein
MFRPSLVAGCLMALTLMPAVAQQPTQAQREAVRGSCRSDFIANCASVQPGGKEALECLMRNDSKLSAPCRSAVNAIAAPAAKPAAPAAAAAPPVSGDTLPPAQGQSSTPVAAVPPAKTSHPTAPSRKTQGATLTPAPATAATGGSASASAAPAVPPLGPIRPMLPRRALMVLAQCRPDQQRLCAGVPAGGGKIFACLAANAQQLSPICYDALARVSE